MVEKQRAMGAAASVVMEGRDIGTVVFPDATIKVFLDASPEERARRRLGDLDAQGKKHEVNEVLKDINERDQRDRSRAEAPLLQAPDAVYLDSTHLNVDEVEERILAHIRARTSNGKEYQR
jgi:cytidylate kinase